MAGVRGVLIVGLAVLLSSACGSGGSDAAPKSTTAPTQTTTTVPAPGTGDGTFTMRTERFVDSSRPTGTTPGRTLPTDIYVPGGKGPFPVIVHSHGSDGASRKFTMLLGEWAKSGYIVVAPNFPLTNADTPKDQQSIADHTSQPADVRFVLDSVLAEAEKGGRLAGLVAADRIGASGLSLGGATTYLGLFNTCCQDDRYRSAVLMSALDLPHPDGEWDWTRSIPLLVFAGTADFAIPYVRQMETVAKLPTPAWIVTLDAGLHATPYENAPDPHDALVVATTIDFWDATLRDDDAARERLATDATVPGLSSVRVTS